MMRALRRLVLALAKRADRQGYPWRARALDRLAGFFARLGG